MCIHSMCRMKFSYCFSLRMTPIGMSGADQQAVLDPPGVGGGVDVDPAGQVFAVEQIDEVGGGLSHDGRSKRRQQQRGDERQGGNEFHDGLGRIGPAASWSGPAGRGGMISEPPQPRVDVGGM